MATIVHGFDWPDRLVIGTIGEPGSRTFYLQARAGRQVVSVSLEKEQSALLAEKVDEILDALMEDDGNPYSIPATTPYELVDNDPLDQPVEEQFRTAAIGLGFDPTTMQVVIEAYPFVEGDEEADPVTDEPAEMFVAKIPVGTARAFAKRTLEIVAEGRPLCPICGEPMAPSGHTCPGPAAF